MAIYFYWDIFESAHFTLFQCPFMVSPPLRFLFWKSFGNDGPSFLYPALWKTNSKFAPKSNISPHFFICGTFCANLLFSIVFNFLPRNNPVGAGTSIFSRSLGIEWELLSRFSWLWILLERKNLIKVMNGINARSQTLVEQISQIGKLFSRNNLINIFEESWRWWSGHLRGRAPCSRGDHSLSSYPEYPWKYSETILKTFWVFPKTIWWKFWGEEGPLKKGSSLPQGRPQQPFLEYFPHHPNNPNN